MTPELPLVIGAGVAVGLAVWAVSGLVTAEVERRRLRASVDRFDRARQALARVVTLEPDLTPELELYNLADPACELCYGLGRVDLGPRPLRQAEPPGPVPCPCTDTGEVAR